MNYHNITHCDMLNGPGLRTVLWVSGCDHHCPGCHNPETWNPKSGILFDEAAKQEIFDSLDNNFTRGLTISGGDPLHGTNRFEVLDFAAEVKSRYPQKDIILYTGYQWRHVMSMVESMGSEFFENSLDYIIDGRYLEEWADSSLRWRGSKNQRIIDVRASLANGGRAVTLNDFPEKEVWYG